MDSLLANYASDDDETVAPAAAAASRREEADTKPHSSSSSSSSGIFSSLPPPSPNPIFSSLPPPKSNPIFSSLPLPKPSSSSSAAAAAKPKRVVQFRLPPIPAAAGDSSDEEGDPKRSGPSTSEAPAPPAASRSISSLLPPPKHSLGLGSGAAGPRRSAIDTAAPEKANLGAAVEDSSEDSDHEETPAPELQPEKQSYDAGAGSSNGYEGYAWDPNYYENYGWDSSGNVNYGTGAEYAAYGGEQHPAAAAYGGDYAGRYGHEASPALSMPEPVLPPEVGRIGGKRGRNEIPMEIVEVNQAELMKNRPREDKSKLTGKAFGPGYQPVSSSKGKPSKLHKRKHQIGSLYFDLKQKEMELAERRARGFLTKAETQGKYGW